MKREKNLSKVRPLKPAAPATAPSPAPAQHNVGAPLGQIHGEAIIRGPDGKEKGRFTFGGPATSEQFDKLQREVLGNGNHSDNGGEKRGV